VHSEDDPYIDQSPEALRLTLVDGHIDLSGFHVYADRSHRYGEVTVTARVIGASHIITYSVGDSLLHEVFACMSPPTETMDNWASILTYSWAGLDHPIERQINDVGYSFEAHTVPWSDPEPEEVVRLLALCRDPSDDGFGFVQHFPQGEYRVTPKTIIVGYRTDDGLLIETAHSYPNVRGLVLSRTHLRTGGTK